MDELECKEINEFVGLIGFAALVAGTALVVALCKLADNQEVPR